MIIYVIEQGQYSDRHVVGLVETEEEAKRLCDSLNKCAYIYKNSATYTPYDTKQFQTKKMRYTVTFLYEDEPQVEYDSYGFYDTYDHSIMVYSGFFVIYADTPEQALKIAYDMRAEAEVERNGLC